VVLRCFLLIHHRLSHTRNLILTPGLEVFRLILGSEPQNRPIAIMVHICRPHKMHHSLSQLRSGHLLERFAFELNKSANFKLVQTFLMAVRIHGSAKTERGHLTLDLLNCLFVPFPLHFCHYTHWLDFRNLALVSKNVILACAIDELFRHTIREHLDRFFGLFPRGILNEAEAFDLTIWQLRQFDVSDDASTPEDLSHVVEGDLLRETLDVNSRKIKRFQVDVSQIKRDPTF